MKHFIFVLVAMVLSSFTTAPPETFSEEVETYEFSDGCGRDNGEVHFGANEEITYRIFYNWNFVWVKAGYAKFSSTETTYAGKPSYLLKASGKTGGSYDGIYKVRDYYHSYVDKETLKPLKYVRDTNEGGHTRYQEIRFDHANGKADGKMGRTKDSTKPQEFEIEDCTFDIVSIMYNMRNVNYSDYKKGDKIPINIIFDDKEYDLHVKYLGDEVIKVKGQGKFKCHKLSPLLVKGDIFTETNRMTVWVTADKNKVPVLIESPIKVGSVKAVISNAKDLKYPIEAKQ